MEKKYKILIVLFVAMTIASVSGFYKSYFQFFPDFENITFFIHIHFVIFLSWFGLLIWQPVLIQQNKFALHRKVGKVSYFLAPLMVISILLMVKLTIARNLSISIEQAALASAGAILDAIFFTVFYVISMVNKRRIRWHVAFVIAASLIVFNPGWGRFITNLSNQELGLLAMTLTPYLISVSVLVYEKIKLKRPVLKSPYLLFTLLWTLEIILLVTVSQTAFWKNFIGRIAAMQ